MARPMGASTPATQQMPATMLTKGIDQVPTIGETAGKVWECLSGNGTMAVAQVVRKTGCPQDMVQRASGWLAREGKVNVEKTAREETVSLK